MIGLYARSFSAGRVICRRGASVSRAQSWHLFQGAFIASSWSCSPTWSGVVWSESCSVREIALTRSYNYSHFKEGM